MSPDALNFAEPSSAWLLLPAAVLVLWAAWQLAGWRKRLGKLGEGPVVRRLLQGFDPGRAALRVALWGLALLLLVGAATRPRYGMRETEVSNAGIDIALVVDASKSMLVRDVVPNRLQGTALEITALMAKLAGGRVALVPFAGIPFVQCPLTSDHDVVRSYLQDLRPEDLPVGGTNIGRALTLATELLTGEREKAEAELRDNLMSQFKGSKHRAIVLFSDGEDHEGAALEAARKAAEKGIRIYTVGVGSAFGDPVPILGPDGTATGVMKDEAGSPIFSKLNMDLMEQLASATGGKAFRYGNQSVVPQLFEALDGLEKAEYQAQFKLLGEDRYQWLLGPAVLLLLLEMLLSGRGKGPASVKPRLTTGRRAPSSVALLALTAAPALWAMWTAQPASAAWLERENPDISKGRKHLEQKQYGEALQSFKQAQASRPEHALIWYNMGVATAWMGQHADAVTALSRALGALQIRDPQIEADIHYALGTAQLAWGQALEKARAAAAAAQPPAANQDPNAPPPAQAPAAPGQPSGAPAPGTSGAAGSAPASGANSEDPIVHYKLAVTSLEQALLADPARQETRRNLELARLGAYPPCSKRDDKQEPNDTPELAKPVAMPEGEREATLDLRMCPGEHDMFRLELQPGDRVRAKLTTKADPNPPTEDSTAAPGKPQIGMAMLSADGKHPFGQPEGAEVKPLEELDFAGVEQAQTVLLDVRDIGEVETPYDLKVRILPACIRLEDAAEPNDNAQQARQVPVGQPVQGRLCPGNSDWFRVPLLPGQGLKAAVQTKVDLGSSDVTLDILDAAGAVLSKGAAAKEGKAARLAYAQGGDVLVRLVGGSDTEADYALQLEILPPCSERDDPFEDNDQALQANPLDSDMLSKPIEGLQLCPGDDDWYAVDLKEGESLFVDLSASIEGLPDAADLAGQLTVEVFDERGQVWGQAVGGAISSGGSVARTVAVLAPPPGRYRVRVTGGGVQGPEFPSSGLPNLPATITPAPSTPGGQQPGQTGGPPPGPAPAPPPQPGMPQQLGTAPQPGTAGQANPGQANAGQAPIPQQIPHIALPPGTPEPAIDRSQARLDLPYQLRLRILPPCPAGNDELEPNDTAKDAKPIEVGGEQLLRICKGDQDWLKVTQKAGQNLQITARYDSRHGALELDALDESGVKELARSQTATAEEGKTKGKSDDSPAARKGRAALQVLGLPAAKADRVVQLRVKAGAQVENFYLLRIDEPPPPSDKDKQDQQDQQDKEKDKDKGDEKKQDEQEKKDEPKKDQDKPPEDQDKKDQQERQRRQMDRNDHNPNNLEAEEAMRRSPFKNSRPDKDW